jgi:phosphatidylglycerophosphate synthase
MAAKDTSSSERHPAHPAAVVTALMAIAVAAASTMVARELGLGLAYVAKALAVYAVVACLVLANLRAHHPFPRFGPANQVTLARAGLVALLAGFVGEHGDADLAALAFTLAFAAAVLDAADGWLARATGMSSAFGARFDMETDAALLLVLAVLAWQLGKAGPWVFAIGLMRYAFVAAGAGAPWLRDPLPPSFRRKAVCAVQMVALVAALAPIVALRASALLAAAALAALCYSFAADVLWLRRHAREDHP